VAALAVVIILSLLPTPYVIVTPGSAVNLSEAVTVEGYAPPVDRFFLTDVSVQRATALSLLGGFLPGAHVFRAENFVPRGMSTTLYDRRLADAMAESENNAAVVAERAAGFHVPDVPARMVVTAILSSSRAGDSLRAGDEIVRLNGQRVTTLAEIARLVSGTHVGAPIAVRIRRNGSALELRVPTVRISGAPRLGIVVERSEPAPPLPVSVRYSLGNIGGSSGGLMLALQIYSTLRGNRRHPGTSIAGTGTLASDGTVGPIEGTQQKLIAAKRAGATIFLVPRENLADVAGEHDVRIVPVRSFRDALATLPS